MRVFVAGVSSERQHVVAVLSAKEIISESGDEAEVEYNHRGEMARSLLVGKFLDRREFDAILLLDLDMDHPPDLLARLRAHDLDIVGGHYFRRQVYPAPMISIVSLLPEDETWPYPVMTDIPREGLREVANAGMGCVLVKREVVEAVAKQLPPFDSPVATRPMPKQSGGSHHKWGSDFAFFTLARESGYKLYVDFSIESAHSCNIWLNRELYDILSPYNDLSDHRQENWLRNKEIYGMNEKTIEARILQLTEIINNLAVTGQKIDTQLKKIQEDRASALEEYKAALARLAECQEWLSTDATPQVTSEKDFPKFEDKEAISAAEENLGGVATGETEDEVRQKREVIYAKEAMGHIEHLDARPDETD